MHKDSFRYILCRIFSIEISIFRPHSKSAQTPDPPHKPLGLFLSFSRSDRDVGAWDGKGCVEKQRVKMWRKWAVIDRNSISLLNYKESMTNTSSEQAGLPVSPAQTHRAEILENPLRVSLFKLSVWSGGEKNDKAVVFLACFLMLSILFYSD